MFEKFVDLNQIGNQVGYDESDDSEHDTVILVSRGTTSIGAPAPVAPLSTPPTANAMNTIRNSSVFIVFLFFGRRVHYEWSLIACPGFTIILRRRAV